MPSEERKDNLGKLGRLYSRPHPVVAEPLEARRLFSVIRPDHIVVVIEQDRASNAIGNSNFPYLNALASTGLYYSNAHGVTHPSEPNTLALYSGSTQGITDNGRGYSFGGANLAKSLFDAGLSFAGYSENLPADGSQVTQAGDAQYPDLYTRNLNAMAQFTNVGLLPGGAARPNSAVNRTFGAFKSVPTTDYSSLPTVSFVVPNNLHSTHGSNEAYPWAGSPDEQNNDLLRGWADSWLRDNIDPYLQWAKTHNSLLIVTQDEERWVGGTATTVTTLVHGDPDLFVPGENPTAVNHYNVLRTIEDMYGLPLLNNTATAASLATNALGQLAPAAGPTAATTSTSLASSLNPSQQGQSVTFTATVTSGVTGATPAGTVTFRDGASVLGTATLNASGVATFATSALGAGSHSIAASYGGSTTFSASTSPALTQTVNSVSLVSTITALGSNTNPSLVGQAVTFTARVTPASGTATPGGSVTFKEGATVLGVVALDATGVASLVTSSLSAGSHGVTAAYGGSAAFAGSTSGVLAQQVNSVVAAPANDNFSNRLTLPATSTAAPGTNVNGSRESGEPRHANRKGGSSVWWTWTAPSAGSVTIDTFGSNFDTLLAVYTGSAVWSLSSVASGDNAAGTLQGRVTFTAVAGRQYQIAVDGRNGVEGSISLRLTMGTVSAFSQSTSAVFGAPTTTRWRTTQDLLV